MGDKVPEFRTDQEAIDFLDQDLSGLDFAQFKPVTFEFGSSDAKLDLRLPNELLEAVKVRARAMGKPVDRYVRELMERDVLHSRR